MVPFRLEMSRVIIATCLRRGMPLLFILAATLNADAQNLVTNGDFEKVKERFMFDQSWSDGVDMLYGWKSPNRSTPNFFHPSSKRKDFCCRGVKAVSGQGFVGIGASPVARTEYIQGELISPLQQGIEYLIELHVKASEGEYLFSDCLGMSVTRKRIKTSRKYCSFACSDYL